MPPLTPASCPPLLRPVARIGGAVRMRLARLGSLTWLALMALRALFRVKPRMLGVMREILRAQVRFTALDALPLTTLTALLLGGVTLLQVYGSWAGLGAERTLSQLLARLVIRELGPLLVAVIMIARSGTAIAAEMGSMQLRGEVDALVTLGVHPAHYLLLTRIAGGMVSAWCLVVWFDAVALLGGFVIAWAFEPLSLQAYLGALLEAIGATELAVTVVKALVFGATIPLLSMKAGLSVRRSPTEVPQAVTGAAVRALVTVFLTGAILSAVFYG